MSMMTRANSVHNAPASKRLERYYAKMRLKQRARKVAWTIPGTLGILLFILYTHTSDFVWPRVKGDFQKGRERVHAWWRATFHDDIRG